MRPRLRVVPDDLVRPILDEAKRILAEIGIEVRGAPLRQRLLEHGLKLARTADDAERVLFPAEVVERAIASAPKAKVTPARAWWCVVARSTLPNIDRATSIVAIHSPTP